MFIRYSGWVTRCSWKNICTSKCNFPWGQKKSATIVYKSGGKNKYFYRTFRIYQSYKCKDTYNNFVPQATNEGADYIPAENVLDVVNVTLKFKYMALVAFNDTCHIQYCRLMVDGAESNFTCPQTVEFGEYENFTTSVNLVPNNETHPFYEYHVSMGSESLLLCFI